MDNKSDLFEKIRQQFDSAPYPRTPLEKSPKDNANLLFIHNLITPYYLRNQKIIETENPVILDAGCGSGYKSLVLAEANPGAKIIGIDISEASVNLARQRLEYHGFPNAEFHVLPIQDLPNSGWQFDYINCDELLYLFSNPSEALQAMKSVLKPDGIIRSNLHSAIQRFNYFRAQKVFNIMGLMEGNPEDLEIEIAVETIKALKDKVNLKASTWTSDYEQKENKHGVLMNYLFQGDKGYTISDMFNAFKKANLEFISMVNWRKWELLDLFQEPDNLPVFLEMTLPEISLEERLQLFELIHPIHRLLDFWCGHPKQGKSFIPVSEWTQADWLSCKVHLHPQLRTPQIKEDLIDCINTKQAFPISRYIPEATISVMQIDSSIAACLLPLWEGAQPFTSLVERWLKIRPVDPVTLEPVSEKLAFDEVKGLVSSLELFLYLLLERFNS